MQSFRPRTYVPTSKTRRAPSRTPTGGGKQKQAAMRQQPERRYIFNLELSQEEKLCVRREPPEPWTAATAAGGEARRPRRGEIRSPPPDHNGPFRVACHPYGQSRRRPSDLHHGDPRHRPSCPIAVIYTHVAVPQTPEPLSPPPPVATGSTSRRKGKGEEKSGEKL